MTSANDPPSNKESVTYSFSAGAGLLGQSDAPQQVLETRIFAQRVVTGFYLEGGEGIGMLRVRLF